MWNANICTFYMVTFLLLKEREDTVTEKQLLQHRLCIILLYMSNIMVGYRKHLCQSSKHCKLVCKRSSAIAIIV